MLTCEAGGQQQVVVRSGIVVAAMMMSVVEVVVAAVGCLPKKGLHGCQRIHAIGKYYDTRNVAAVSYNAWKETKKFKTSRNQLIIVCFIHNETLYLVKQKYLRLQ